MRLLLIRTATAATLERLYERHALHAVTFFDAGCYFAIFSPPLRLRRLLPLMPLLLFITRVQMFATLRYREEDGYESS